MAKSASDIELLDAATSSFNSIANRSGHAVHLEVDLAIDLGTSGDLDNSPFLAKPEAIRASTVISSPATRKNTRQTDWLITLGVVDIAEATLWQTHPEWELTTFKEWVNATTTTGGLTFFATTTGLTDTTTCTTTYALDWTRPLFAEVINSRLIVSPHGALRIALWCAADQGIKGGANQVDGVRRTVSLGQDVVHTQLHQDTANALTSNNTSTVFGRNEANSAEP